MLQAAEKGRTSKTCVGELNLICIISTILRVFQLLEKAGEVQPRHDGLVGEESLGGSGVGLGLGWDWMELG